MTLPAALAFAGLSLLGAGGVGLVIWWIVDADGEDAWSWRLPPWR